ncbi:collectin-10 [Biomphalaria glabrata]|nr:collectin-10-like [Biomphalaria glabrata]
MTFTALVFLLLGTINAILAIDIKVSVDNAQLFTPTAWRNKLYYVSKPSFSSFADANTWCAQNGGGYAAEIDSTEELWVLQQYVPSSKLDRIYIAGTDAQKEGEWLTQRKQTVLHVFDWYDGEPNNTGGQEACLELYGNLQGRMNDCPCDKLTVLRPVLCEVDLF